MNDLTKAAATEEQQRLQQIGYQAKVYAARMRLQGAMDQADALDGLREIAGNLIGTEEVAVFKIDKKRAELWLYWSFGVDPNKHAVLEVEREPKLRLALGGKPVFRLSNENLLATEEPVNAIVPIVVGGRALAVIVLFRLFAHKAGLEAVDREICDVLAHCAGRAIEPYHSH